MSEYRLLIVSNNCLSQHDSNGRTLLNMLSGFKRENLYQIYTSGEFTDDKFCAASYRVTNRDVVNAYRGIEPRNEQPELIESSTAKANDNLASQKNAATMILRDIAWDWNLKLQKYILRWAESIKPDAVVLQLGDSTHLIHIAINIVKHLNVPLITYNTEDYYFKDYDFMKRSMKPGLIYKLFHKRFCRIFRDMMKLNPTCIYNCDGLRERYDTEFGTKSEVVFCSTDIRPVDKVDKEGLILYAGNLGVGRHIPLIEIGKELAKNGMCIDVYGNATDEVRNALGVADGVRFHGFVSYEENCHNIERSRLLIHVEGFDEYYSHDTRYAFSTKIADYCASGIPVLMYAPEWCESTQYAIKHDLAFVVCGKDSLIKALQEALYNNEKRTEKIISAQRTAAENHQMEKNMKKAIAVVDKAFLG